MGERPAPPAALRRWVCTCTAAPTLGVVVGGALRVVVPQARALHYPDRIELRCPACRNTRVFWTKDLSGVEEADRAEKIGVR